MINSFNDFYNNLSSNGLFFFWVVVFLFVFVIFLLVVLLLNTNNNGLYTKNVLREKRVQTSPIHIDRELSSREELPKEDYHTNEDILLGIDLHEDALSPLETMEDAYEVNDNMKFASDIVERMEEEIKPSNIELTDYERKQEEEAIISYDELLKVKDKIYNITDDEETDEFIDELKNFRTDLQ